jgi:hypothetical protein
MYMNKNVLLAVALLAAPTSFAQRDALIDYTDKWNLFSKFELGWSEIDSNGALMGGVVAGGYLNDKLGIGLAGRAVLDEVETESPFLQSIGYLDFWYGGLYTEYVFNSDELTYFSVDLLLGGGILDVERTGGGGKSMDILAVEPGVNFMVNITETFMFGLGASYRFIENVNMEDLDNGDLSGPAARVFLRFTQF